MKPPSRQILIQYFLGQCPVEEAKVVEAYLSMHKDKKYIEDCIRQAFYMQEIPENTDYSDIRKRVWNRFSKKQPVYSFVKLNSFRRWYSYAAVIVLFIIASGIFYWEQNGSHRSTEHITWKQLRGTAGTIKVLSLIDSTEITLFPSASINIPSDYNSKDRFVQLNGRAFFKVAHNKEKPFYVKAGTLTTRVLGTSFEINTNLNDNTITLHTGSIGISRASKEIVKLSPNEQIQYKEKTGEYHIVNVDAPNTLGWMKGEFNYDNTSLSQIVQDIEAWYGVKACINSDTLARQKITFSFNGSGSLNRVLLLLSESASFDYKINNQSITIKEKNMQ